MNRRAFLTTAAMTPILASAFGPLRGQTAAGRLLYVGTYTNNAAGSKGIYAWRFDAATSTVTSLGLAGQTDSPSWVVVHPNKRFLYAANELPPPEAGGPAGAVTAFSIDAASGKLTQIGRVKTNGLSPAHMLVDPTGKWAIVGNYGNSAGSEGTSIAVFAIGADGNLADTPKAFEPTSRSRSASIRRRRLRRTAIRRPRTRIACCCLRTAGSCSSRRRASTRLWCTASTR